MGFVLFFSEISNQDDDDSDDLFSNISPDKQPIEEKDNDDAPTISLHELLMFGNSIPENRSVKGNRTFKDENSIENEEEDEDIELDKDIEVNSIRTSVVSKASSKASVVSKASSKAAVASTASKKLIKQVSEGSRKFMTERKSLGS